MLFSYSCVLQERHIYIQMAAASMKWNLLSHPFVLHQWECQCNLFNKLYEKVYALCDRSLHFLPEFNIRFKKKNTAHCISAAWGKKWKLKENQVHLGSRWTSEIKIGPLRCKCWNNILHVGSKLLMYIVYKPGVSLSRVATPAKWSWWRCCWSKSCHGFLETTEALERGEMSTFHIVW